MTKYRLVETVRGAAAVVRRDAQMFWSYRLRVVSQTLSLLFSLTLFYYVSRLVSVSQFPSPDDYFAFVAVGLVILTVLTATLTAVPLAVRQELVAGTFERFVVSPLGPATGIAAMAAFPVLSAVAMATLQMTIAAFVFGIDLSWSTIPLASPVALLSAMSFAPFALFLAAAVMMAKQISGGITFVTTGFAFIGGFFFPVALLPGWIRWASDVQPFTPSLELLRHFLLGTDVRDSVSHELVTLVLFTAVLLPVSWIVLERAIAVARRRGTVIEY